MSQTILAHLSSDPSVVLNRVDFARSHAHARLVRQMRLDGITSSVLQAQALSDAAINAFLEAMWVTSEQEDRS